MFRSSENITLTAGIVLGVLYGGKTAIGINPGGTNDKAVARVCGAAAPAPTADGAAPPPGAPGTGFPMGKKSLHFRKIYKCFELTLCSQLFYYVCL